MNSDNRARRLFTGKERLALLADANGHCRACGAELRAGFHANHMTPFSQGGRPTSSMGRHCVHPVIWRRARRRPRTLLGCHRRRAE